MPHVCVCCTYQSLPTAPTAGSKLSSVQQARYCCLAVVPLLYRFCSDYSRHVSTAGCACRTCNELNAGYAADGFCRRKGVGACVVTYGVGGLSVINACAGCYSEDLPVIFVSGNEHRPAIRHEVPKQQLIYLELACYCFSTLACQSLCSSTGICWWPQHAQNTLHCHKTQAGVLALPPHVCS